MPPSVKSSNSCSAAPRLLFMGTPGHFSLPPLVALLAAGIRPAAVLVPAPRPLVPGAPAVRALQRPALISELPMLAPPAEESIISLAWSHDIPVYQVGRLADPAVLALAGHLAPDLIAVACFPAILPPALLAIPSRGALNVHPSLLPAYRGPVPLFWVFRHGERRTGVTIHWMDVGVDSGPIVAQEAFDLPDGTSGAALNIQSAEIGSRLLVGTIEAVMAGKGRGRPQDERAASYYSWPEAADFEVPVTRSARWAFNFIRGADEWGGPFVIVAGTERIAVDGVVDFEPGARLDIPSVREGDEILIQFTPGVLRATLAFEA